MMLLPLFVTSALAADDSGYHLAQARQFANNKWYDDAAAEIEAGLAAPGGSQSFELHWLGAQVYYELGRMDRARDLATVAADLAPDDTAREQATAMRDAVATTFGSLTLTAPYPGMRSRLQLESTSLLIDPELKRIVNKVALQLRDAVALPVTVWVPEGDYLVNGRPIHVAAGGTSQLKLELDQLGARGIAALQVSRLEISLGTAVPFGDDVANLRPGGAAEIAFTQPLGPVLLGALVSWDARSYIGGQGQSVFDPFALEGGLRIGRELVVGGPLAVRPSLGVRYGTVPGIALLCDDAGEAAATCPGGDDPAFAVFASGRAISPFAEVAVEYREAGRTTALGVGVKAVVAEAIGSTPTSGTAMFTDGDTLTWTGSSQPWTATVIRLYTNLDLAF
jgi:hypothetical protein